MFYQIFTKKMVTVILLFLVVLTVAAIACAQGQEDKFPIMTCGGLHAEYFPQIMDCNFNAVFRYDFDESDFIVADAMGLHLITANCGAAAEGQWSEYESDFNGWNPEYFSHGGVIGGQVDDPNPDTLSNQLAWVAQVSVDTAGWMQRGLMDPYNNEQEIPTYWGPRE